MSSIYENGGIIGQTLDLGSTEQYIAGSTTPSYVGSASASGASTLSLTGITGLQEGDLVLFWATDDTQTGVRTITSSGWTVAVQNSNNSIQNIVAYKIMGSTVDTSVSVADTVDALTATAWRGVEWDSLSGFTTASSNTIDPVSSTVTTDNSVVVVLGAIDDDSSTISSAPTGYTTAVQNGRLGGSNAQMYKTGVSAGTEDPSSYTWSTTDALLSRTVVLKPTTAFGNRKNSGIWNLNAIHELAVRQEILSITVGNAVAAASGSTITAPLPSNVEAGDILILYGDFGGQVSALSTPSGWTADNSTQFNFVFRKIATGSDTAPSITKDTTTVDHAAIMFCVKKRNLSISYGNIDGAFDSDGSISFTAATGTGSFGDLYLYIAFVGGPRTETTAVSNMTKLAGSESTPLNMWYYAIDIGGETITNVFSGGGVRYTMLRYPLS